MKRIVVFGGGTGLSCLLSGLKLFPVDVTAVITVSDNGSSTGVLKEELDIPAVGDVGKVLLAMSNADEDFLNLLSYRFSKSGTLHNHPVRNIMLSALIDLKGSLTEAAKYMGQLLQIKGTVLPLTEDRVELVGESSEGSAYVGEEEVSRNIRHIRRLRYDHDITVTEEVKHKLKEADLVIFSPGSLYTSIIPHLIAPEVGEVLRASEAPLMYVSNLVTQPGEMDGYDVSGHVRVLNRYLYLFDRHLTTVVANNAEIDPRIIDKYLKTENKTIVHLDREKVAAQGVEIIEGDIFSIEEETIRHNAMKTAFLIFSYLM
ncbi:MAG: YvcK family protein, partial [Lachnospiraceae bacterium]|nr:YvcK family protein [Lachnospiraceae bacterium]